MEGTFGEMLKRFRERKFPGKSLRRVAEEIKLGETFYAYLNKIETGTYLPSEHVVTDLIRAYRLTNDERVDLLTAYFGQKLKESRVVPQGADIVPTLKVLFRKVKKNK